MQSIVSKGLLALRDAEILCRISEFVFFNFALKYGEYNMYFQQQSILDSLVNKYFKIFI